MIDPIVGSILRLKLANVFKATMLTHFSTKIRAQVTQIPKACSLILPSKGYPARPQAGTFNSPITPPKTEKVAHLMILQVGKNKAHFRSPMRKD